LRSLRPDSGFLLSQLLTSFVSSRISSVMLKSVQSVSRSFDVSRILRWGTLSSEVDFALGVGGPPFMKGSWDRPRSGERASVGPRFVEAVLAGRTGGGPASAPVPGPWLVKAEGDPGGPFIEYGARPFFSSGRSDRDVSGRCGGAVYRARDLPQSLSAAWYRGTWILASASTSCRHCSTRRALCFCKSASWNGNS